MMKITIKTKMQLAEEDIHEAIYIADQESDAFAQEAELLLEEATDKNKNRQFIHTFELDIDEGCDIVNATDARMDYCSEIVNKCISVILDERYIPQEYRSDNRDFYINKDEKYTRWLSEGLKHKIFEHEDIENGLQNMASLFEKLVDPDNKAQTKAFLLKPDVTAFTLFVMSLLHASKLHGYDKPFGNMSWATLAQIDLKNFNALEINYLEYDGMLTCSKNDSAELLEKEKASATSAVMRFGNPPPIGRITNIAAEIRRLAACHPSSHANTSYDENHNTNIGSLPNKKHKPNGPDQS